MSKKDKAVDKAKKVAAALADAKTEKKVSKNQEKSSKKATKNQEKTAKSQEYERGTQFEEGQFGGTGAVARARARHFASSGQRVVRHPGVDVGVPEDEGDPISRG